MPIEDGDSIVEPLKAELKDEVAELKKEVAKFRLEHKQISRNSRLISVLRYSIVLSLGGIALIAALLSGINYERKTTEGGMISFRGADFSGALQTLAGVAGAGSATVGFGDRLIKFLKKEGDED